MRIIRLFLVALVVTPVLGFGQEPASYKWEVSAKKLDEKTYELSFTTPGVGGWQLYMPNQDFDGYKSADLSFADSSINSQGNFAVNGDTLLAKTPLHNETRVHPGNATWTTVISFNDIVPGQLQGSLNFGYGRDDEFYPAAYEFSVQLEGGVASATRIRIPDFDITNPVNACGDADGANKSLFGIFLLGLAGGFIALLTPCVFPMIPLTVSFFTKKGQSRKRGAAKAALYGFFIFLIYVLLSLPFHIFNASPQVLNNISTNMWMNLFFFVIFLIFAISFFGYFDITLPGSVTNRINARSGMGIGGIFFMAFTLAIVSFSCTGPILGSLLVGTLSDSGGPLELSFGMGGFGLALALPFAIFAVFPNWLQSLPKSGGWLNSVKVVLGFLELAMAIKFLSNADLVEQWGIVKREVFFAVWILLSIGIILYLLGKLRFPHDSPVKKFSKTRIGFILFFLAATLYLLPGVTNTKYANLKLISGFPPPLCYSIYEEPVNCKTGFEPLRDYNEALAKAKAENKPVLIDFTGWACVNCRRMEEAVWTSPVVDSLMRTHFVVVSLYVDERTKLPIQDRMVFTTKTGEETSIVTVGDKWSNFQIENFNATSQPQYAIISNDERPLTRTKGYTPDADEFADWLRCGLEADRNKKSEIINKK